MKQKITSSLLFVMLLIFVVLVVAGIQPSVAAPSGGLCSPDCLLYMPYLTKPVNVDFAVTDIEVFQATQTDNNTVPLVAGKTAVARIYAQLLVGTSPNNVQVSLTAVRNGSTLGTVNASGPATVPASPAHGTYNSTYNVILPTAWLSGQVQLTAKVDSTNAHTESNEGNNQFGRTVTFNNVPDLQIVLVPINYTHTGATNPGNYPGQSVDNISDWISRAFPMGTIDVQIRTPYTFIGDLENVSPCLQNPPAPDCDWANILDEMYVIKLSDGLSEDTPIVYYGLIPVQNGANRWFFGGIAGIGWVSPPGANWRESVGLNLQPISPGDDTGILAGHEIGHNLGRRHAPCGGAAGADPAYPYAGASIGQFATDIQGNNVFFHTPASHVDMMSYCSPEWISDYTYTALYNNQRIQGLLQAPAQTADHLIIRASINDNQLNLAPTYIFSLKSATTAVSSVTVELLDNSGAVIAAHPIAVREAEEEGIRLRSALGAVPLPAATVAALRLVENGAILAERQLAEPQRLTQAALSITQAPEAVTLNWGLPDVPAIVRYTTDDGLSWTTLAINALGGSYTVPAAELTTDGRFEIILANTNAPAVLTADFTAP